MRFLLLPALLMAFFLSACKTVTPPAALKTPASWQEQQTLLSPLIYWRIEAKLGIKTAREAHSVLLNWQQDSDDYTIDVSTPIGTSVAHIEKKARGIALTLSPTEMYHSSSLEELLWRQLGWWLPAEQLFYWVRGLPAPVAIDHQETDAQFRLTTLEQSGWVIAYADYMSVEGYALPRKITLTHPDLKLTLLISQWGLLTTP